MYLMLKLSPTCLLLIIHILFFH